MLIQEQIWLPLNGQRQFVSIRGTHKSAPLLLYLHGGPGDAALPLVRKYNQGLERHFTLVVWEQRGAGKSYYSFGDTSMTIDLFLQDLHALASYLLSRFSQPKLFLIGHSWGSVLGLRFLARHPEMVRAYIGCGQVVHMKQSCRAAYEFALAHADPKALHQLRQIDCTYAGEGWLKDLLFVTRQVVKHKGSLYGKSNYNSLILPFLLSSDYSLRDVIRRQKGSLQSIKALWQELMKVDFTGQASFPVPVIFVEGRHDQHVSSALARQYFETLTSEKQFHWFEQSCHFPQWSESDKFNQLVSGLLL